ncbi:MAG: AraC family transcriptional regulator [Cytophagaceae bacterium]|nr:AraC family transcriptional regulator [Cytophagaceae bacterium]
MIFFFKKYAWLLVLTSTLFWTGYFIFFYQSPAVFFPKRTFVANSYTDSNSEGGQSIVHRLDLSDSILQFQYQLRPGFHEPYCGFSLSLTEVLNVRGYDRLTILAKSDFARRFLIHLTMPDELTKGNVHPLQLRHLQGELVLSQDWTATEWDFKSFITPDWWLATFDFNRKDLQEPQWEKLKGISFTTGSNNPNLVVTSIAIKQIQFSQSHHDAWLCYFIFISLLGMIGWAMHLNRQRSQSLESIVIHYKAIHAGEKKESFEPFLQYIHQHYDDPELTLTKISEMTKIPARVISVYISEKFNTNIKTYINQIRIVEAQRLMKESSLNISEIGYKVGFNSPTHFNRVFKSITGQAPGAFIRSVDYE